MKTVFETSILHMNIAFHVEIWKEGNVFIALASQLGVTSCGDSMEEARQNIQDAVAGFLKGAKKLGTLEEILEEAGFRKKKGWEPPEILSFEKIAISLA